MSDELKKIYINFIELLTNEVYKKIEEEKFDELKQINKFLHRLTLFVEQIEEKIEKISE